MTGPLDVQATALVIVALVAAAAAAALLMQVTSGRIRSVAEASADTADASQVAAIPGVASVTTVQYADVIDLGAVSAPGFGMRAGKGELAVTAVEGRVPVDDNEVLLPSPAS